MKVCNRCNVKNIDDAIFCRECGNKLPENESNASNPNEEKILFCSNCGFKLPPNSDFCPNCGNKLKSNSNDYYSVKESNSNIDSNNTVVSTSEGFKEVSEDATERTLNTSLSNEKNSKSEEKVDKKANRTVVILSILIIILLLIIGGGIFYLLSYQKTTETSIEQMEEINDDKPQNTQETKNDKNTDDDLLEKNMKSIESSKGENSKANNSEEITNNLNPLAKTENDDKPEEIVFDDGFEKKTMDSKNEDIEFILSAIKDSSEYAREMFYSDKSKYLDYNDYLPSDGHFFPQISYRVSHPEIHSYNDLLSYSGRFFTTDAINKCLNGRFLVDYDGALYVANANNFDDITNAEKIDIYICKTSDKKYEISSYYMDKDGKYVYFTLNYKYVNSQWLFDDNGFALTISEQTQINVLKYADETLKLLMTDAIVSPEGIKRGVRINSNMVNVRTKGTMKSKSIGKVMCGEFYEKTGNDGDWSEIEFNGRKGYVLSKYTDEFFDGNLTTYTDFQ